MKVYIKNIESYDIERIYSFFDSTFKNMDLWEKLRDKKTILLKPNLLSALKPEKAVTTHPIILEALIQLLQKNNKQIWIGDSPGGTAPVEKVWQETGIKVLAEKYDIKLLNFKQGEVIPKNSNGMKFYLSKYFWDADAVINIAKLKTHTLMNYTGAVKNLYGIIPGLQKSEFHKKYPSQKQFTVVISELYQVCREKLALNIIDGILGMEGEGPSAGIPRNFGMMFVSEKASALDYIASGFMGFREEQVNYVKNALKIDGIKPEQIAIPDDWIGFKFKNVKIKKINLFLKVLSYSPEFIRNPIMDLFKYYPAFNEKCIKCNICVKTCPVEVMTLGIEDDHPVIDHDHCIKCMCCHEVCPEQAIYIHRNFFARSMIK